MIAKNLSHAQLLSRVSKLCDPMDCTVCQIPLSTGFSRQEYWKGLPCPLQGILLTQGEKLHLLCLLPWQVNSSRLSHLGSPAKNLNPFLNEELWLLIKSKT